MKVMPIKTEKILNDKSSIIQVLDKNLPVLKDGSIVVITSKIISICECNVIQVGETDKETLVEEHSDRYLPKSYSKYGFHFTIKNNRLIPMAGIDESNGNGYYILWPSDAQQTANKIREYLSKKYNLKKLGVIVTDSTCQPLTWGTVGIALAHSGFSALKNYIGTKDLFGRNLKVTQSNISGGLASAAVLAMGEGAEQTPICIVSELSFVSFQNRNPTKKELANLTIDPSEDLFAPFLLSVNWKKGRNKSR